MTTPTTTASSSSTPLSLLGALTCTLALTALFSSILTHDWLTLQEPTVDPTELEKSHSSSQSYLDPPKPHLLKAKFGLLKVCCTSSHLQQHLQQQHMQQQQQQQQCHNLFSDIKHLTPNQHLPSSLITNIANKIRFTLPFMLLSIVFTSAAFLSLTLGHFCKHNKKIIEAALLILAGLCSATALLTFVSQIGSEFDEASNISLTIGKLTTFYRYKYGYSFYLFLLSFSLSELAALLDMAAYFKRNSSSKYHGNGNGDDGDNESTYFVSYSNPNQYQQCTTASNTTTVMDAPPSSNNPADIMMTGSAVAPNKLPPHSYITFVEDVVAISSQHNHHPHYATTNRGDVKKLTSTSTSVDKVMHSFATLRKHNNQL